MDETYREHCPLLREELSAGENSNFGYQSRGYSMTYRSRSRNNIRGAASIITRWPDHWSAFITYWWIGLGMICITTFIIYNCLFFFSMYPSSVKSIPTKLKTPTTPNTPHEEPILAHVYMHIVVNYNASVDFMQYLQLIEVITKKYTAFCYHFIIVQNDTLSTNEELSAEKNNENALNIILSEDFTYKKHAKKSHNILIEHVSLSKLMDDSPAKKYWRLLSFQFVEFLIRAASIWEKGGIAFNPLVLKSQWYILYIEKLKNVFETFQSKNKRKTIYDKNKVPEMVRKNTVKFSKRVNNIRDIINALDNDNNSNYSSDESLIQAENRNTVSVLPATRRLLSVIETNINNDNISMQYKGKSSIINHKTINNNAKRLINNKSTKEGVLKDIIPQKNENSSNSLLPLFLDFLFHHYPTDPNIETLLTKNTKETTSNSFTNEYEVSTKSGISNKLILNPNISNKSKKNHPIVVPVNKVVAEIDKTKIFNMSSTANNDSNRITIDIKGNVIATETKCHAVLGTIFNNAVHQERDETLTDFIISQLSIFCKGVLSSCIGIDLILL